MSTHRRFAVAATAALLLPATLMLAACSSSSSTSSSTTSATSRSNSEASTPTPTAPGAVEYALPDGVEQGSDAALAWEALMSPVGEYAAAASYAAVIDAFGDVEPYVTIKAAEERHIMALTRQLQRMGVDVPANPYLGVLSAPADLQAAATAWATGEVANVEMYDKLLAQSNDANLTHVLTNLRRASLEEHLPAFKAAAENGGILTDDQMSEYLHSGGGMGGGMGSGMGSHADGDE